jgi:hypothetical protein
MKHADVSSSEKEAYQRNTLRAIDAALARCGAGIRSLDRKNESAAVDEALPKFNALIDHDSAA